MGMTGVLEGSLIAGCYSAGGVVYASGNGDYAEWLELENEEEKILKTDIVGVKGGKISKNTENAEQVMVISFAPIVLGAEPPEKEQHKYKQVAFMGQVPVKVLGDVKSGDYIIPSGKNDGIAMAISPEDLKLEHLTKIIGRSWTTVTGNQISLINIVVGVKTNEWVEVFKSMNGEINTNASNINNLKAEIDPKINHLEQRIQELEMMIKEEASIIENQ